MDTEICIGFSNDSNASVAAQEAAQNVRYAMDKKEIHIAIVFSTTHYDPNETIPTIRDLLHTNNIVGSSCSGIILNDQVSPHGIGILAIHSDKLQFGSGYIDHIDVNDPAQSGANLGRNCLTKLGTTSRHVFLFFMDDNLKETNTFLKGIQSSLGNIFPIVGIGSSDDFLFENNFQFYDDKIKSKSAAGVVIGGNTAVGIGYRHGWRPLGKPRFITQSYKNIVQTIDGKPAFNLYRDYFGEEADNLIAKNTGQYSILYPLGIAIQGSDEYIVRNISDVLEDGSIVCHGDIPKGHEVHIMIGNKESCQSAAIDAAFDAQTNLRGKEAKLVLIFESMTRLKLFGKMAFQEIEKVKTIFEGNPQFFGMYGNGEVCPFQTSEKFKLPLLQNESIIVVAIA